METFTLNDLEKQVKDAARTLEATERLIKDLQIQVSTVQDDDTLKRLEAKTSKRPRKRRSATSSGSV